MSDWRKACPGRRRKSDAGFLADLPKWPGRKQAEHGLRGASMRGLLLVPCYDWVSIFEPSLLIVCQLIVDREVDLAIIRLPLSSGRQVPALSPKSDTKRLPIMLSRTLLPQACELCRLSSAGRSSLKGLHSKSAIRAAVLPNQHLYFARAGPSTPSSRHSISNTPRWSDENIAAARQKFEAKYAERLAQKAKECVLSI